MRKVDLCFPFTRGIGCRLPLDHGYPLFSALSHRSRILHEKASWSLHLVTGRDCDRGFLVTESSKVRIRLPAQDLHEALVYIDHQFHLFDHIFSIGAPTVVPLRPASTLLSEMILFKCKEHKRCTPDEYLPQVRRHLQKVVKNLPDIRVGKSRCMRIRSNRRFGCAVRLDGLSDEDSLRVQDQGLGSRRHMGGGTFSPLGYFHVHGTV